MTAVQAVATATPSAGPSRHGWHRLADHADCPRKFAVFHVARLHPPRPSAPLAKGALVHVGLMHHYGRMAGFPWARDPIEAMRTAPGNIAWVFEECRAIVEAYRAQYPIEPFRVLDVEREFEVCCGEFTYTARMDLIVELAGNVFIYEAKTGRELRSPAEWERNGQILGQAVIARKRFQPRYGLPFGGVVLNQIQTGETRSFRRTHLRLAEGALVDFPKSVHYRLRRIADDHERYGDDPWAWPADFTSCVGRYGRCPLYDACNIGKAMMADWAPAAA